MQTQEIQLETHDNLVSIRDHMAWAHTPRVLLIWPLDGRVNIRPSDLVLVRRHAEFLGQELGIVTRDRTIKAIARNLNISVFSRVVEAQDNPWVVPVPPPVERRFPRSNLLRIRNALPKPGLFSKITNPFYRILILAAGVLSVLAVILVFIPTAEIQIAAPEQSQNITIPVSSEPDVQNVQISGVVPQHLLAVNVSGQDTALATGSATLLDKKATGEVLFTNLTGKNVNLPSGSILRTNDSPPVLFETLQGVQILAGKGKTASVPIQAKVPGMAGNVNTGTVIRLDGDSGSLITVTNPAPIAGGTERKMVIATDQDRENLKKRMLADLQQQALERFSSLVSPGDVLFLDTIKPNRVIDEIYSPQPGEAGEKLSLNLNVEFGMAYASYVDLHNLADLVLNASLPAGYMPDVKQINIKAISGFTRVKDVIHWQMSAERKAHTLINPGDVISTVQGKSVNVAGKLLTDTFSLTQAPGIKISPGWWPWLPFLPIRITVKG